jgi:hypothetical protein
VNASPEGGGEVEITTSEMDADIPCSYPATITVDYGDDITIEAIPSAGYHFTGWEGEPTIDERRNPIKTTFDNPMEITATFALDFIEFASGDGMLSVSIPAETIALDGGNEPLTGVEFAVVNNPPLPYQGSVIEPAYNLEPSGATFEPPATLTWAYGIDTIPEGVAEEDLVIAYYDENGGRWIELENSEVDPEQDIITAPIVHLTTFAMLAPPATPSPESPVVGTTFTTSDFIISPGEVNPGEEVTISALVTNQSQAEETQTIALKINGAIAKTQEVTLGAGAFTAVTFTVVRNEAGTYLVELQDETGEFTVEEANSNLAPPSSAQETPSSGINWTIMAPILTAIFLAIFLPIWIRRRRDRFDW